MSVLTYSITAECLINRLREHNLIKKVSENVDFERINIEHISYDSRDVREQSLFICKGFGFKSEFLKMAISKGAKIYVSEVEVTELPDDIPFIIVTNARKAMSVIAMEFYGNAYKNLNLVGVTGTKGKTTTTYFIHNIFNSYVGRKTAVFSTVEVYTGKQSVEAHLTTPESLDLHRLFNEVLNNEVNFVTMEVSSQAYKLDRVYGMGFDYGMFINIGEDHIGPLEHDSFEDYFSCKLEFVKNCKTIIINGNTEHFDRVKDVANSHCQKTVSYGLDSRWDFYGENIIREKTGFSFDVVGKGYRKRFSIKMAGYFNVENAVGAIALAKTMGIDDQSIFEGVQNTTVMGRMNLFEGKDITVIVDYAHNAVSFTKLYESLKLDYPHRRLVVVFGSPGGRSQIRRRDVAKLSGENADFIYLTAEDPQFEDVRDICIDILQYLKPYGVPYEIIEDRETAVKKAILEAKPNDVVLLAAKGEETYQKVRGEYVPYPSDYKLAEKFVSIRDNGDQE